MTSETWQRRQLFRQVSPAEIVVQQILKCRDRGYYQLHEFVVMPDHFHALLTPGGDTTLEKALQMIKGGSAIRIRKELQFKFPVWQTGFHDRWLRDADEYSTRRNYILGNPVKARLAVTPSEYPWSSANRKYRMDDCTLDDFKG